MSNKCEHEPKTTAAHQLRTGIKFAHLQRNEMHCNVSHRAMACITHSKSENGYRQSKVDVEQSETSLHCEKFHNSSINYKKVPKPKKQLIEVQPSG